ncbi:MAG: FecR domain-containing protein [Prolixibacteraceae bacterium]|nr:FecR domain-containing protein [Prolixibacteraceae bacterium]
MKNNNQLKKAEDIIVDDALADDKQFEEGELRLAREIKRTVETQRTHLGGAQKELLENRIARSINQAKRNQRLVWIGSAAAILAMIGLTVVFQLVSESGIRDYALGISLNSESVYTRLILSGEEEILINTQESKINYSPNGNQVSIDAEREINQPVDGVAYNTVIVPYGKRSQITLPDSSTIWLNSGSKLVYPVRFAKEKREVYLDGEAMFDVAPDKSHPFHVLTPQLEVKVLGTVFNLCAYSDDHASSTVLESGSVELSYKGRSFLGQSKEMMVPGMLAVYDPLAKTVVQTKVNTKHYTSWVDGYLVLEKNSLGSIVKKLSRYYNVSIELDNPQLAGKTFSGDLDLRNSASQVLELIAEIVDIEIIQFDNHIAIREKQN